nr:PREDICTED: uncharacterized protein LOC105267741 [Fopius arisanus]
MPSEEWVRVWIYLNFVLGLTRSARPRFDTSTDMGMVLVPADAEIESVIFRLRATDQDADFPLVFDIAATVTPVVRIENLPCTLYNKICQANVILTKRLTAGRLHDFAVRVRDSKGDFNSMQATISVTNATTQRDKIFPHIPAIIMVPEDAKPGKELDYVLARANQWSGKPVYIELWQPKELFTIRQRQTPTQTRGVITLIGELDFEMQSMYTLTLYATDPYTEPKKDTRNIAGLHLVVIVQDVQDVPPIFTHAPPLTKINNTIQPGDVILRVHAEDGDKGVPREITYGLVSEGNPFVPFFNISESTGEIILAKPLKELTQITHVGAPVVLSVVAEEIRRSPNEPPAQATVVEVGLLLGEPGNSPPYFDNDNYVAWMDENPEPGSPIIFSELYSTEVKDEDIGKAGVFALKLENNNGTFEISPTVAERVASFIISVRDNTLIDYEVHKSLRFEIVAQEVGPATNLSASVPVTIFIRDVNDNSPEFQETSYEVTLSENVTAGTRVVQVHAVDKDTGLFGRIQYTRIIGPGSDAFVMNPDTGFISVAMGANSILDREITPQFELTVEARDEDGKGLRGSVPLIIKLLDVNDNAPVFEKDSYNFVVNGDFTNFTVPAIIKATDADAEPPNNEVRYELIHGNYENYFLLDEVTGEIFLSKQITKARTTRHNPYQALATKFRKAIFPNYKGVDMRNDSSVHSTASPIPNNNQTNSANETDKMVRRKRQDTDMEVLFTLTARAYDLGVPHLSGTTQVNILQSPLAAGRIVMFVVAGENPDPVKTAQTLATITGGHITVKEIRPYVPGTSINGHEITRPTTDGVKRSIVIARVEPIGGTSLVDIDKIRAALAANGVGVIGGDMPSPDPNASGTTINTNNTITSIHSEEVTVYKAENKLLFWLLIILGLLILAAIIALIVCCICPGCPLYMAPRKRRIHSSETLVVRPDGRPKRHLHRKYPTQLQDPSWSEKKQAWSADPMRSNWQFNRRNTRQYGLASLPGDVVRIPDGNERWPRKAMSLRGDAQLPVPMNDPLYPLRQQEEHRIYMENIERAREYEAAEMDSLRRHEFERGSDLGRQQMPTLLRREPHFYRDGNAEVMRLVSRGGAEETLATMHRPPEIIIDQTANQRFDGKDILLRRFIEDQKFRGTGKDYQEGFQEDFERQSMESHQRQRELSMQQHQRELLLIPKKLEVDHRQHLEQLGPDVQRLIIDHGSYEKSGLDNREQQDILTGPTLLIPMGKPLGKPKETSSLSLHNYTRHELEVATQNALLTRLLLERDGRVGASVADHASYLETQSLPGQVAAGTQTDKTAATQTEYHSRSRSDNESEEDSRIRKKMRFMKRYGEEPKRIRTLWMKSPIEEEERQCTGKRSTGSRRKMRDVTDDRTISIEPEVLREISDSLDENVEVSADFRKAPDSLNSQDESREEDIPRRDDSSSIERVQGAHKKITRRGEKEDKRRTKSRSDSTSGPSFHILEKEMSSLSRKLSKLTGRKASSEEDSGEKHKMHHLQKDSEKIQSRDSESRSGRKIIQKAVQSVSKKHVTTKKSVSDKSKVKPKLRRVLPMSTASSDWEESVDKSVKSKAQDKTQTSRLKLPMGKAHAKLRRQGKMETKGTKKSVKEKLIKPETQPVINYDSQQTDIKMAEERIQPPEVQTSIHEIKKSDGMGRSLEIETEKYSDYVGASASGMREDKIIESVKIKSPNDRVDVESRLELSDEKRITSRHDMKGIESIPKAEIHSATIENINIASPGTTEIKLTKKITPPATEISLDNILIKSSKKKRVRLAVGSSEEETERTGESNVDIEEAEKGKLDRKRRSLRQRTSKIDKDSEDQSMVSDSNEKLGTSEKKAPIGGDPNQGPNQLEGSFEKERISIIKSPKAPALTIPDVQTIKAAMDGIIEKAKTVVAGTTNIVGTTDDAREIARENVEEIKTEGAEGKKIIENAGEDGASGIEFIRINSENGDRLSPKAEKIPESGTGVDDKTMEVVDEAMKGVLQTVRMTAEATEKFLSPKLDFDVPETGQAEVKEKIAGDLIDGGKNVDQEVEEETNLIREDFGDAVLKEMKRNEENISEGAGGMSDYIVRDSQSAGSSVSGMEKYSSTASMLGREYKVGVDPEKSSTPLKDTSAIQSTTPESQMSPRIIESGVPVDVEIIADPEVSDGTSSHLLGMKIELRDDLRKSENALEPSEWESLETASMKSEGSQSSKSIIIMRETCFLSSPKRELPKPDSIAKSEKTDDRTEDPPEVAQSEKSSEFQLPDCNMASPISGMSPELSHFGEMQADRGGLVSEDRSDLSASGSKKIQMKMPILEPSSIRSPDSNVEVATPDIPIESAESSVKKGVIEVPVVEDPSILTSEIIKMVGLTPEQSDIPIPDVSIEAPTPEVPSEPVEIKEKDEICVPEQQPDLPDLSLEMLEEDSDLSSESSARTTFIAQPYGTPRHRKLIRMVPEDDSVSIPISIGEGMVPSQVGSEESGRPEEANLNEDDDDAEANKMINTGEVQKETDGIRVESEEVDVRLKEQEVLVEKAGQAAPEDQKREKEEIEPIKVESHSITPQEILPDDDGSTSHLLPDLSKVATRRKELKTSDIPKVCGAIYKIRKPVSSGSSKKIEIPKEMKDKSSKSRGSLKESRDGKMQPGKSKKIQKIFTEGPSTSKLEKIKYHEREKLVPLETTSRVINDPSRLPRKSKRDKEFQREKSKTERPAKILSPLGDKEHSEKKSPPAASRSPKRMKNIQKVTTVTTGEPTVESLPTTTGVETTIPMSSVEQREVPPEKAEISVSQTTTSSSDTPEQLLDQSFPPDAKADKAEAKVDLPLMPEVITDVKQTELQMHDKLENFPKHSKHLKEDTPEAQSRYMAWYKEMQERKEGDDQEEPPKWLRKSTRQRWLKMSPEDRKHFDLRTPEVTPLARRKIIPSKNVESEQLKAIVRQGRKLRRAEGGTIDPQIEIFAPEKLPPLATKYHHLIQHSEYKYEKIPFYLHPPPVPHPSPQVSPRPFEDTSGSCSRQFRRSDDDVETGIILTTSTPRLRHQQLLEKKSVFDIAYSEAAPSQLRADSTTPPS